MNKAVIKHSAAPNLPNYAEACRVLASLVDLPDIKTIRDQAIGVEEYAKASKDAQLLDKAVRIRFEATRNIGRVIKEMQQRGELHAGKGHPSRRERVEPIKTLKELGLTWKQSSQSQWLWHLPQARYDRLVQQTVEKLVSVLGGIFRQSIDDARKATLYAHSDLLPDLHLGDFRELSPNIIADESIQLVFTDPPYDRDAIPLYEAAACEAARILKPGGSLICYCGHVILPEVVPRMLKHLRYFWIGAAVHDGGPKSQIINYGIEAGFKPLLWFVKDHRGDKQSFVCDTYLGKQEKSTHPWQQAVGAAEHFIRSLTLDGSTVVDFFAGGGTTIVAAENLKRKWIAFEKDSGAYAAIIERMASQRAA
jgi:hypothetical protein